MPQSHAIFFSTFVPMAFLPLLTGCGPELSDDDLGRVEHRLPEIPGAEKPYELPDLTQIEGPEDPLEGPEDPPEGQERSTAGAGA